MNKILDALFRSELALPMDDAEELSHAQEQEMLLNIAKQLRSQMTSEQIELWESYIEKQEHIHDCERQWEFERGFCLGGTLILRLLLKADQVV